MTRISSGTGTNFALAARIAANCIVMAPEMTRQLDWDIRYDYNLHPSFHHCVVPSQSWCCSRCMRALLESELCRFSLASFVLSVLELRNRGPIGYTSSLGHLELAPA